MLSIMESYRDIERAIADTERAGAAPYVDFPKTPFWYPPTVGLWAAAMTAAPAYLSERPVILVLLVLMLVGLEAAFVGWYRRRRGTMPSMRGVPREIGIEMLGFVVGFVVVVAAIVLTAILAGPLPGTVVALVLVTAGVAVYEHRYAAAAEATRRRLA